MCLIADCEGAVGTGVGIGPLTVELGAGEGATPLPPLPPPHAESTSDVTRAVKTELRMISINAGWQETVIGAALNQRGLCRDGNADVGGFERFEVLLSLERGFAAQAGRRDRLFVADVLNVAADKNARDVRRHAVG